MKDTENYWIVIQLHTNHLTSNNISVKEQFGFRWNNSTETAIYTLINNILSSLNDKILVGGLFCDLEKAFDCVNYDMYMRS